MMLMACVGFAKSAVEKTGEGVFTVECVLLADGMIGGQLVRVITLFFWSKKLIGKERSRLPRDTPFR
jgi:hypothetical protein